LWVAGTVTEFVVKADSAFTIFLRTAHRLLKEKEEYSSMEFPMRDISFVLATMLFFGIAILYLRGCERLK
jgi:hypothetical protein